MDTTSNTMQAKQNAHLPLSPTRDGGPLRRLGARGLCYRFVDIAVKRKTPRAAPFPQDFLSSRLSIIQRR